MDISLTLEYEVKKLYHSVTQSIHKQVLNKVSGLNRPPQLRSLL